MGRLTSYRVLCGVVGLLLLLLGLGSVLGAFAAMGPGGAPPGPIPVGPGGVYFIAFAGTALIAWGGGLLGAVREPEASRSLATAVALVIGAVFRAFACSHPFRSWSCCGSSRSFRRPRSDAAEARPTREPT